MKEIALNLNFQFFYQPLPSPLVIPTVSNLYTYYISQTSQRASKENCQVSPRVLVPIYLFLAGWTVQKPMIPSPLWSAHALTPWEKEVLKMHWEDTSPKALGRSGLSHPLLSPFYGPFSLISKPAYSVTSRGSIMLFSEGP